MTKEFELSFLNPAILYALAAAAIPLLIHLLNRRKIKKIPFSTIQFLKRLEKKQMRNLRIRQLLLLLLRTAIILLLVIGFARPTLQSGATGLLVDRSPIEAVIILDNSLSLNETMLTGTLVEQLRQAFNRLETVFVPGDRISVIQATRPSDIIIRQEPYQPDMWERVRTHLQPNYLRSNMSSALQQAVDMLENSIFSNREVYLVSDFQQSAFDAAEQKPLLDEAALAEYKLFTIPIRHSNAENISVDSVEVLNRLIEVNQSLRIRARLRNHDSQKHLNSITSVVLNGSRMAQQNVSIAPNEVREVQFELTLTESGFVSGKIEIENDALQEDNQRYFNFYVPTKVRILHLRPDNSDAVFFPLIIQPALDRNIFEYAAESVSNWSSYNFFDYDVVVLEDIDQLPETLIQRLHYFVDQGGGALIIPGQQVVTPLYRKLLSQFAFGDLVGTFGSPAQTSQFLTSGEILWDHPVFEGLFETQNQLNPIETYAGYKLRPLAGATTLVKLSDRSPLILQSEVGDGTAFFISVPLLPEWSQLPFKGFVVPLIYRMIYYSATRKVHQDAIVRTGEPYKGEFSNLKAPFDFRIVGDNQVEIRLTPEFRGSNVFLGIEETPIAGNFRMMHNEAQIGLLSVNPWNEESRRDFMDADQLAEFIPGTIQLSDINNVETLVKNSRFGRELWKQFLIGALILLLVEMIIARSGARKELEAQLT